jgi:hypothetical protein
MEQTSEADSKTQKKAEAQDHGCNLNEVQAEDGRITQHDNDLHDWPHIFPMRKSQLILQGLTIAPNATIEGLMTRETRRRTRPGKAGIAAPLCIRACQKAHLNQIGFGLSGFDISG